MRAAPENLGNLRQGSQIAFRKRGEFVSGDLGVKENPSLTEAQNLRPQTPQKPS